MPGVWEHNHVRHFWDDRFWPRHFKMIKLTFEMLSTENYPLVSPVIQSHPLLRQSHVSFVLHIKKIKQYSNMNTKIWMEA